MRVGLRVKIIGIGALVGVVSFFLFSLVLLASQWGEMEGSVMRESRIFAVANARGIHEDYRNFQIDSDADAFSAKIANRLAGSTYVTEVALVGINGRIIFDSGESIGDAAIGEDAFLTDSEAMEMVKSGLVRERFVELSGKRLAEIYAPVTDEDGQHVTSVRYVVSFASRHEWANSVLKMTLAAFLPFMLFVIFLLALFAQRVVAPICRLDYFVRGLGSGRVNGRMMIGSKDEIGELAESFNKMAEEVIRKQRELEDANRELEGVVHQRSAELQEQNIEVTGANAELERMNKFMIGRELRMVELKNEIDDLKEKLAGKP